MRADEVIVEEITLLMKRKILLPEILSWCGGELAVFISNRRRSPDIKYGCVSMLPLCGDVSGVSNSDMVRPYEHMYGLCRPPKHGCD